MSTGAGETNGGSRPTRRLLSNPWLWLGTAWLTGLCLGFAGLYRYALLNGGSARPLDLAYLLLQLIALESGAVQRPVPWALEIARFGLPALAAWTVVRAGMTVFRDQAARLSLRLWKDHIILCGLGRKGYLLMQDFRAAGERVVVIEADAGHESFEHARKIGAVVLTGDATDPELLRKAGIERARTLVAVLGEDGMNAEVAVRAEAILCDAGRPPLHCIIHIVDPDLWDLLRDWELGGGCLTSLRVDLFNIYQRGAGLLLAEYPVAPEASPAREHPHGMLVIGMGNLGRHLLVGAAETWYRRMREVGQRLEVIVVDQRATQLIAALYARYPRMEEAAALRPVEIDVRSAAFVRGDYLDGIRGVGEIGEVFICMDDDARVLSTALTVNRHLAGADTDIVMRMFEENGLSRLVGASSAGPAGLPRLVAFPLLERTCTRELLASGTHERLARALHETYVGSRASPERTDDALQPWDKLPEALRQANRRQADHIAHMLSEAGFALSLLLDWGEAPMVFDAPEIEQLARMEHARWCDEKWEQGWHYAAGSKDGRAKTHPALLPWEQLPAAEQEKNRATIRALPGLLHKAGFRIQRGGEVRGGETHASVSKGGEIRSR